MDCKRWMHSTCLEVWPEGRKKPDYMVGAVHPENGNSDFYTLLSWPVVRGLKLRGAPWCIEVIALAARRVWQDIQSNRIAESASYSVGEDGFPTVDIRSEVLDNARSALDGHLRKLHSREENPEGWDGESDFIHARLTKTIDYLIEQPPPPLKLCSVCKSMPI